jgi:hypothetical protein
MARRFRNLLSAVGFSVIVVAVGCASDGAPGAATPSARSVSAASEVFARAVPEWNGTASFRDDGTVAADGFDVWLAAHSLTGAEAAARVLLGAADGSATTTDGEGAATVVLTIDVVGDDSVDGTRYDVTFELKDNRPVSFVRATWVQKCARGNDTSLYLPRACP